MQPATNLPAPMRILLHSWLIIPMIFYWYMVNMAALNIPYLDDYEVILQFLTNFKNADLWHKITLLFALHGEHRIVVSKIVYALYYTIFRDVNFIHLIYLANLQLVVIYIIAIGFLRKLLPENWQIASFAFGICLFDINNFENADWAMAAMQNYGVIMFFMASLWYYNKPYKRSTLALAILFQLLCIYSSGNGFIGALVLVIFNFLQKNRQYLIACAVVFAVFTGLYFLNYHAGSELHNQQPATIPSIFFHLIGAHFGYNYGIAAGVIMLVLLIALSPLSKGFKPKDNTLPFIAIALFAIMTISVIPVMRGRYQNTEYSCRYFIYSHILTAIIFIFLCIKLQGKKFLKPVSIGLVCLLVMAYLRNKGEGESGFAREYIRLSNSSYESGDPANAKLIAIKACEENIYCIEEERKERIYVPGARYITVPESSKPAAKK